MFESVDGDMLGELMKLDAVSTLNKTTRLSDLLACLDKAAQECKTLANAKGFSETDAKEAVAGIDAAKQIVEHIWASEVA